MCPGCKSPLQVFVFPALTHGLSLGSAGERLENQDEASCFYHPQKKATLVCEHCGRLLCALCDIEVDNKHICPQCVETGAKKKKLKGLEHHRTLYDSIALGLSLLPLLMWPATLITAPIALYVAIRYWKAPTSIVRRTKFRLVLAILFASLQIIGWSIGLYYLFA